MPPTTSSLAALSGILLTIVSSPHFQAHKQLDEDDRAAQQWWKKASNGQPVPKTQDEKDQWLIRLKNKHDILKQKKWDEWKDFISDLKDGFDALREGPAGLLRYVGLKKDTERRKKYLLDKKYPNEWQAYRWRKEVNEAAQTWGQPGQKSGQGVKAQPGAGGHGTSAVNQYPIPYRTYAQQDHVAPQKHVAPQRYPIQPVYGQHYVPAQNIPTGDTRRAEGILHPTPMPGQVHRAPPANAFRGG